MKVELVAKTVGVGKLAGREAQDIVAYCSRVSSPKNQENFDTAPKLIKYCINNKHWSILEQSYFTFEIETTRSISAQILRHKSFNFQEFSQRYSEAVNYECYEARRQDDKNRQNSIDDMKLDDKLWWRNAQDDVWTASKALYDQALKRGVAKEVARSILPMNTKTTIYMSGNLRDFVHYVNVRGDVSTQKEHRDIANAIKAILATEAPDVAEAVGWT